MKDRAHPSPIIIYDGNSEIRTFSLPLCMKEPTVLVDTDCPTGCQMMFVLPLIYRSETYRYYISTLLSEIHQYFLLKKCERFCKKLLSFFQQKSSVFGYKARFRLTML